MASSSSQDLIAALRIRGRAILTVSNRGINVLICAVCLAICAFVIYKVSNLPKNSVAIELVQNYRITFSARNEEQSFTIGYLVENYDPEKKQIQAGLLAERVTMAAGAQPGWKVTRLNEHRYLVSCESGGRVYSFETDLTTVEPVSQDAQAIFDLQGREFE